MGSGHEGPGRQGDEAAGLQLHRLEREGQAQGGVGGGADQGAFAQARGEPAFQLGVQGPEVGVPARVVDPPQIRKDRVGVRKPRTGDRNPRLWLRGRGRLDFHGQSQPIRPPCRDQSNTARLIRDLP